MGGRLLRRLHLILTAAMLPLAAEAAPASAERGAALAERWCVECHVIAPDGPGGDAGPPFASLPAEDPATDAQLRAWLFDPHQPMDNIELSPTQINDILLYIRTIRPEEAAQ